MNDQSALMSMAPPRANSAHAPASSPHTAQAIQCGRWSLALSFDWANTIIDQFELVNVPKAPSWLIGAANLDGSIVPVVDLAVYIEPDAPTASLGRQHRLLMGGRTDGSNENAVALLFSGLPFQIQYARAPLGADVVAPESLRQMCRGLARSDLGQTHFEIDTQRFIDNLSLRLMDI